MEGWVKIHRKLLQSDMFLHLKSKQQGVMITCLLLANHKPKTWEWGGELFTCIPGQFITSLESLAKKCASDIKVQSVRTALLKLEKWQFLTNESTKQGRLITICNWDTYQAEENSCNKQTNKELTNDQQTTNKRLTTNKNDKNDKNDKENTPFNPPQGEGEGEIFNATKKKHPLQNFLESGSKKHPHPLTRVLGMKKQLTFADCERIVKDFTDKNFVADVLLAMENSVDYKKHQSVNLTFREWAKRRISEGNSNPNAINKIEDKPLIIK